jgi:hypothetical protein
MLLSLQLSGNAKLIGTSQYASLTYPFSSIFEWDTHLMNEPSLQSASIAAGTLVYRIDRSLFEKAPQSVLKISLKSATLACNMSATPWMASGNEVYVALGWPVAITDIATAQPAGYLNFSATQQVAFATNSKEILVTHAIPASLCTESVAPSDLFGAVTRTVSNRILQAADFIPGFTTPVECVNNSVSFELSLALLTDGMYYFARSPAWANNSDTLDQRPLILAVGTYHNHDTCAYMDSLITCNAWCDCRSTSAFQCRHHMEQQY